VHSTALSRSGEVVARTAHTEARTLGYFAIFNPDTGQGIQQKITGFLHVAERDGWKTRAMLLMRPGLGTHLRLGMAIARATEDVLVVRSTAHHLFVLVPFCLLVRRRSRLVLDVPTPHRAGVLELWRSAAGLGTRLRKALLLVLSGPFVFWPFHRVLQYADEGSWWLVGNRRRTLPIGNGIDLCEISARNRAPAWPDRTLRLIAVANVSFWHGYDRLLRAMRWRLDQPGPRRAVELTIVGAGEALPGLQALVKELGISDIVRFAGPLRGEALYEAYCEHHVGVASLALHRKKLSRAAELKAREYCAVGIPFIAAGEDPDFDESATFRYEVTQSEVVEDVVAVLERICDLRVLPAPDEIRSYASAHVDALLKFRQAVGADL
jgi:glycosyltransferase involved in cell wall biosynthesis